MTTTGNAATLRAVRPANRLLDGLMLRMRGPGGYYNIGNVLALVTGLGLQVAHGVGAGRSGMEIVSGFFAGSPQAVAFTVASGIFICSGEVYHRAFRDGTPDRRLTRIADFLSALGAVAITVSLVFLGQAVLALVAGTLLVSGKLGSAMFGDEAIASPLWPARWPDPFRLLVLFSRVPALIAPTLDLLHQLALGSPPIALIQPAVLIACLLLWGRADLLLLGFGRRPTAAALAG